MVLGIPVGRIMHIGFDAVLISTVFAGIRRSTGLTVQPKAISDNTTVTGYLDTYLWMGEAVMDQSVAFMSMSKYVERKR
ncbi:DUF1748-domain-containing protein [Microthyrium microscopicum]|uniref:DUF1748-domain-containing protein n=1 Tax=Microthyrium microscopicum TaxID=703497 RepID=A0A6A6U6H6_9PEZI|nr:DUF1748-domain-containing protein [Microthyrium microscopicum]